MGMYWAAVHRPCTGLLFKTVSGCVVIREGQTGDLIRLAQGMNIPSLYGIQDLDISSYFNSLLGKLRIPDPTLHNASSSVTCWPADGEGMTEEAVIYLNTS